MDFHELIVIAGAALILSGSIAAGLIFWIAAGQNLERFVRANYRLLLIAIGVAMVQLGDLSGWLEVRAIGKVMVGCGMWAIAWEMWQHRQRLARTLPTLNRSGALGMGAIAEGAGRYLSLLSMAGLGVAIRDVESGQVLECNARFADLLDRPPDAITGLSYSELLLSPFRDQERLLRSHLIRRKIPSYEATQQVMLPRGYSRWLRTWSTLANGGSKTLDIAVSADVEMEAKQRLEESVSELEAANYELEGFSYACAHDLKAPLRRISQRLQAAIALDNLADKNQAILEEIDRCARLQELIDKVLEYARLGQEEPTVVAVSLHELAATAALNFEGEAAIAIAPLPTVQCNPIQIGRLFLNLFSNSVKHAIAGHPIEINVNPSPHQLQGFVSVDVQDNGPGVPEAIREKLFDPFVVGEKSKGTGLGLAICKKIVKAHQGNIKAIAIENGIIFRIQLPCHSFPSR